LVERRIVAGAAVFTAFVAAATMAISAYIAATGGYFNVGEVMVYTAALLMGPYVGAFAGGVGSMISDLALGYPQFAPGTLVIKATEGFIVGYLGSRALGSFTRARWISISIILGLLVAGLLAWVGTTYFSGALQFSLGVQPYTPQPSFTFDVPPAFWLGLAAAALVVIVAVGFSVERRVGWLSLSVLLGGSEMVLGYFLYETVILGQAGAAAEVPFNIAQAVIGLIISIPLVRSIRRVISNRGVFTPPRPSTGANP